MFPIHIWISIFDDCMIIFLRIITLSFQSHQICILSASLVMAWNRDGLSCILYYLYRWWTLTHPAWLVYSYEMFFIFSELSRNRPQGSVTAIEKTVTDHVVADRTVKQRMTAGAVISLNQTLTSGLRRQLVTTHVTGSRDLSLMTHRGEALVATFMRRPDAAKRTFMRHRGRDHRILIRLHKDQKRFMHRRVQNLMIRTHHLDAKNCVSWWEIKQSAQTMTSGGIPGKQTIDLLSLIFWLF